MNSLKLKRMYTKNYEAFFNQFDLVVSAPVLGRYPGTGLFKSKDYYIVSEKYPLRNYIGINFSDRPSRDEIPMMQVRWEDGKFLEDPVTKYYPISYSFLKSAGFSGSVGFFSEYNTLDAPSIISATVVANMLANGSLQIEEVTKLHVENPEYTEILARIVARDKELLDEFGFFEKRRNSSGFIGASILTSESHLLGTDETTFRNIGSGYRFEDANHSSFLLNPHVFHRPFFQSDSLFAHGGRIESYASELGVPAPRVSFPDAIESIGNAYAIEIFSRLKEVYDQKNTEDLFNIIRLYAKFKHGVFLDALERELDVNEVWKYLKNGVSKDVSGCAVQMGTRVQVFGDRGFDISDEMLGKLKDAFGYDFTLDYSSHRDGFENDGVRIEQWCSKWIFSEFLSENELISLRNSKQVHIPVQNEEILNTCHDGILVDLLQERLLIKWVPATSAEIKSQVATIDLLARFLKNQNREACSWDLPMSSYTRSRSEMSSKIIGPLQRIIHENFGKFMNIAIRNEDRGFIISFDESCPVPIYLLHKRIK